MTRTRNMSDLLDSSGDVKSSAWYNTSSDLVDDSTPQLGGVLDTNGNNIEFPDSSGAENNRLKFGSSDDLHIFHDATHSYIQDNGTGDLRLTSDGTGVFITKGTSENMAQFRTDGAVNLYHDNSFKFATTSSGAKVIGTLKAKDGSTSTDCAIDAGNDGEIQMRLGSLEIVGNGTTRKLRFQGRDDSGTGRYADIALDPDAQQLQMLAPKTTGPTVKAVQIGSDGTVHAAKGLSVQYIKTVNLTTSYQDIVAVSGSLGPQEQGFLLAMSSENGYHQAWVITGSSNTLRANYWGGDMGHTHSKDVQFRESGGHLQASLKLQHW